jgi:hypothetical protein
MALLKILSEQGTEFFQHPRPLYCDFPFDASQRLHSVSPFPTNIQIIIIELAI